jgi:uncharacterized membrane protein
VKAILKKRDASLPANYRPISLISCVGKIMERVIYKDVYNYLVRNKFIYEYQSGFLPRHSTDSSRLHKQVMMLPCLSLYAFFDTNNVQTI